MSSTPTLLRQTPNLQPTRTEIVAGQIRAHCGRQRISQSDLAEATGLSRNKVNRIWHGKRLMLEEFMVIAAVLDVPMAKFLAASDEVTD